MKETLPKNAQALQGALETLRDGGILLYPTDTVWGLGCDATCPAAVERVFALKKRPENRSLILLASDLDMVAKYVEQIPPMAIDLVEASPDAPLTLIYPKAHVAAPGGGQGDRWHLAHNVVAEDGSVAVRIPCMDWCRELIFRLGRPIVSTSANFSGSPTPVRFTEIAPEIKAGVDYVVPPSLDTQSTGKASPILRVGMRGEIEIVRK